MLQLFSNFAKRGVAREPSSPSPVDDGNEEMLDPMAHAAFKAMTPHELADIPFPRPRRSARMENRRRQQRR